MCSITPHWIDRQATRCKSWFNELSSNEKGKFIAWLLATTSTSPIFNRYVMSFSYVCCMDLNVNVNEG